MDRRHFFNQSAASLLLGGFAPATFLTSCHSEKKTRSMNRHFPAGAPRAITMWDFSWLERRWDGAGYENWDQVLDELTERGYNAIRLDAYPHLTAEDPDKKWVLKEEWNQQVWGSPDLIEVQIQPYLNEFLSKCRDRDIKVGLSSWFREDIENVRMKLHTPEKLAECWMKTIQYIEKGGLLDTVLYVDLCNEFPGDAWAPYFAAAYPEVGWGRWFAPDALEWMKKSLQPLQAAYPDIPFIYSFDTEDVNVYEQVDASFLDFYEHHIWMAQQNRGEYYKLVGYDYGRFSPEGYKNVVKNAERVYKEQPDYWQGLLTKRIRQMGNIARKQGRPLITTECWGIVDYKDWPMLKWDWVKELCALGTITAAETGMWAAISTSNFCGPQFVGMWRDIEWHRQLTSVIRSSSLDPSITQNNEIAAKLLKRL
ncbi:MAG: cellulase [Tannerellaceae bacterium]|nr:cellulase [Tannerellaceae bacterium]